MMTFEQLQERLKADPRNESYTERGISPILQVSSEAKILIIGQAPGQKAEESQIPFHDKSGETLRTWMGVDVATFYSKKNRNTPHGFLLSGQRKKRRPSSAELHCKRISSLLFIFDAQGSTHHFNRAIQHRLLSR